MHNVVHAPEAAALLRELDHALTRKLGAHQDEFLPGMEYIRQWGYKVAANVTVPYME